MAEAAAPLPWPPARLRPCWQALMSRIAQPDFAAGAVEFEPERGFQQRERRRAGPGLRRACHRIERRAAMLLASEAAEQFGQPPQVHVGRGVEQSLEHLLDRMFEAIA